jgi:hypothetical protein
MNVSFSPSFSIYSIDIIVKVNGDDIDNSILYTVYNKVRVCLSGILSLALGGLTVQSGGGGCLAVCRAVVLVCGKTYFGCDGGQ